MLTEFKKKKLTRVFQLLDVDRNGVIERADYDLAVNNLAAATGVKRDTPEYKKIHAGYMALWEQAKQSTGVTGEQIRLEQWLAAREALLQDREQFEALMHSTLDAFFQMLDTDRDDVISYPEFTLFYKTYNMDLAEAPEVFQRLDLNRDGKCTRSELRVLVEQFYHSEDPADPGTWLYGKI
jgi:Ca2+-binding EF-hand superfamily protein